MSIAENLRRYRSMDRLLASQSGLKISVFAKHFGVSEKTIRRDLKAFAELKYEARAKEHEGEREYIWKYKRGTQPMFRHEKPKMIKR